MKFSELLFRERWLDYLGDRVGTYEYRTLRFAAVYDELLELGLKDHDLIVDVGAGMCDFARYIYSTRAFDGRYVPLDGSIDGTDLEEWSVSELENHIFPDWYVCIETIEHLHEPYATELLARLKRTARKGVVLTTPNPVVWEAEVGSVANLDPTHHTQFTEYELNALGFKTKTMMLFGKPDDTIVATFEGVGRGA